MQTAAPTWSAWHALSSLTPSSSPRRLLACNQACLDHTFKIQLASCLVNPRAGHETTLLIRAAPAKKRFAVVGAGPAGLAAATTLAERGHEVDLYDAAGEIGGQFNLARRIPGKEEFSETLRYFRKRIERTGVRLHLGERVSGPSLIGARHDAVLLATGVSPRDPKTPGEDSPGVISYIDAILGRRPVGLRVALIGAGGIGFDVAELLVHDSARAAPSLDIAAWQREWGVTDPTLQRGGVTRAEPAPAARQVTLLQRKAGKLGAGLGKTTGWIHRAALKMKNVQMVSGVNYERIGAHDGALGLFVTYGDKQTDGEVIACDSIVLCAGQEPLRELQSPLEAAGATVHLIGGAHEAGELDAKRAIDQGMRRAASL